MAINTYAVGDAETVKRWSLRFGFEALPATYFGQFMGESMDSMIVRKTELEKGPGDRITCVLSLLPTGAPISGGPLEGQEEAIQTVTDSLVIDELDKPVKVPAKRTISQQRVGDDLREVAFEQLKNYWTDHMDTSMFNVLAGYTAASSVNYTGMQAATAPTTGRHLWCDASAANGVSTTLTDATIASTDTFTLKALDHAKLRMSIKDSNGNYRIRPLKIGGKKKYVAFLHPIQVVAMRTDAETAGQWYDIQQAAIMGGDISENPIYTGALGEYNGIILHEAENVPTGAVTTTDYPNVRRAIICGAQAAHIAFGQNNSPTMFSWTEKLFQYDKELGVNCGTIFGMKKTVYNSIDYGAFVLSSAAVAV